VLFLSKTFFERKIACKNTNSPPYYRYLSRRPGSISPRPAFSGMEQDSNHRHLCQVFEQEAWLNLSKTSLLRYGTRF